MSQNVGSQQKIESQIKNTTDSTCIPLRQIYDWCRHSFQCFWSWNGQWVSAGEREYHPYPSIYCWKIQKMPWKRAGTIEPCFRKKAKLLMIFSNVFRWPFFPRRQSCIMHCDFWVLNSGVLCFHDNRVTTIVWYPVSPRILDFLFAMTYGLVLKIWNGNFRICFNFV